MTLRVEAYRLFAAAPGEPLPPPPDKTVRHSKGDATGHKAERPALRAVSITRFAAVAGMAALVDRLSGVATEALGADGFVA